MVILWNYCSKIENLKDTDSTIIIFKFDLNWYDIKREVDKFVIFEVL